MVEGLRARDPRSVGPYRLLGRLGAGGMGQVFLGRSAGGRLVAVKVPHKRLFRSQGQVELFLTEARIAAGLRHEAIVKVYDVGGYDDEDVFVVFEYVPGRNLSQVFKAGWFPPPRVASLMVRVAEVAHLAPEMRREDVGAVDLRGDGGNTLLGEILHRVADQVGGFAKVEVERG